MSAELGPITPPRNDRSTPLPEDPMSSEIKPTTTALTFSTPAWTAGIYGQLDAARPVAELLARAATAAG